MENNPTAFNERFSLVNKLLAVIYLLTNILFILKYEIKYFEPSWTIPFIYAVIVCAIIFLPLEKIKINLSARKQFIIYFSFIALIAIGLTWLMSQFNPDNIGCSRFPAIRDWLTNLFEGNYPYTLGAFTSGFPFLFISAIPFYLLGDIGLYQIFSFVAFAAIIYFKHDELFVSKIKVLLLLIASPLFLYEVVVRSELFSNMVIVLLYLTVFESFYRRKSYTTAIILGFIGGLLLSTRGIVLIIYIIYLGYMFRRYRFNNIKFLFFMFAGFALTLLPFMIWNWHSFINSGPFTVQMWYCPKWLLAIAIIAAITCGLALKSSAKIYFTIAILLFTVVTVSFGIRLVEYGFKETILRNLYDISYYCLVQPFLLLSFNFTGQRRIE